MIHLFRVVTMILTACLVAVTCQLQAMTLIVMRHGQATHNIEKIYNSDPEHPNYRPAHLTATGREQVKRSAEHILEQTACAISFL